MVAVACVYVFGMHLPVIESILRSDDARKSKDVVINGFSIQFQSDAEHAVATTVHVAATAAGNAGNRVTQRPQQMAFVTAVSEILN